MTEKARSWQVVALLWGVGYSNYLSRYMLITMHGSVVAAVPMTDTQFALLSSLFLWIYGFSNPIGGFLGDRIGRSRVIVVSMIAWSALTIITAFAHSFTALATVRALMGISQACYIPAAVALIADYHRGSTRSFATGVHMTGITLGVATSGLGGWLAERHTIGFVFATVGTISLVYAAGLGFFLRDAPATRDHSEADFAKENIGPATESKVYFWQAIASLFTNLSYVRALIYWGLIGAATGVLVAWMPTYLQERFSLAPGRAGFFANGFLFCAGVPGLILGGAWADRWGRRNIRAPIYVPVIGMLVAVPTFWLAGHAHVIGWVILNLIVWGIGNSFAGANMMPTLCLIIDRRYRATGYGVLNAASAAIGGVVIYLGGRLRDSHVDLGPFLSWMGLGIAGCALLLLTVRTGARGAPPGPPAPVANEVPADA
jgi:MFS family permease